MPALERLVRIALGHVDRRERSIEFDPHAAVRAVHTYVSRQAPPLDPEREA